MAKLYRSKVDNRWHYDISDRNGQRRRRILKIAGIQADKITKKQATEAFNIILANSAQGINLSIDSNDKLFEHLVKEYLLWCEQNHRAANRDKFACQNLLKHFKGMKAIKVNTFLVERYKSERRKQGIKPTTIDRELTVLIRMYNLAHKWGLVDHNPIKGLEKINQKPKERRILEDWEVEKLYESSVEHLKPIIQFLYTTGARIGEALSLKWVNVDLSKRTVKFVNTKTDEDRTIPLNSEIYSTMLELKKKSNSKYVFSYNKKKIISVTRSFATAVSRAGIEHCTPHNLRHTFTSNLIVKENMDFKTVMTLTGHKDISVLKIYTHSNDDARLRAVEKLEKRVNFDNSCQLIGNSKITGLAKDNNVISLSSSDH